MLYAINVFLQNHLTAFHGDALAMVDDDDLCVYCKGVGMVDKVNGALAPYGLTMIRTLPTGEGVLVYYRLTALANFSPAAIRMTMGKTGS